MEVELDFGRAHLDVANACGDLKRLCIRVALTANISLHHLIHLYDIMYIKGSGELWYYDESGNFVICVLCDRGAR